MKPMLAVVGYIIGALFLVGLISLTITVIPWLLWNHVVSPTFGWPQVGFLKGFLFCWFLSFMGNLIFKK